jgi:HEAT repeat protein
LLDAVDGERSVPTGVVTMALLHIGPVAEEPLRELGLTHESPRARKIAAELLGVLGAFAAIPALTTAAHDDPDETVRTAAVAALGRIGHPQSVEALAASLTAETPAPRAAAAARALGQIGSPEAIGGLRTVIARDDHMVAREAAAAMSRLGPAGRAALHELARSDDKASQYARGALSAADARAVRSGRAA